MNITIRPAAERDIPKLLELLTGICRLHQQGRPQMRRTPSGATSLDSTRSTRAKPPSTT